MKKAAKLIASLAFFVFMFAAVHAASSFSSPDQAINTAYQCLQNATQNNSLLSLQEAVFSTLALGYQNSTDSIMQSKQGSDANGACWPMGSCTLKDTAQVALAYSKIGKNYSSAANWIIYRNASSDALNWFLEVDISNHGPSSCTISDGSNTGNIAIGSDMKITGTPGSCFNVAQNGYLLSVSPNCLDKTFTISCDQDFISTLLYQKASGGNIFYVSSNTHSQAALGSTEESITAKCFTDASGKCDYEGSLWATLALQSMGYDVTPFMPYLLALADDNQQYFPSAFIYSLAGGNDQYSAITSSQIGSKYWQASANNSRLYDTSLALLALQGTSSNEASNAKQYLLNIQQNDGCWNNDNIRDSAFILFSGWPRNINSYPGSISVNGNTVSNGALSLTVYSPQNGATYSGAFLINASAGNNTIFVYNFGGSNISYTGATNIQLPNGTITLNIYAANDSNQISQTRTFSIINSTISAMLCSSASDCQTGYTCQNSLCQQYLQPPTVLIPTGNGSDLSACSQAGYSCTSSYACLDAGGTVLSSYDCSGLQSCCSVQVAQQSCTSQGGVVCSSNQQCTGNRVASSDGTCCLGACQNVADQNSCETLGTGTCRSGCLRGEVQTTDSCSTGQVCCAPSSSSGQTSSGGSSLWIWLILGILIILALLGIKYKDKLKIWVLKLQDKLSKTPIKKNVSGMPQAVQRRPLQIGGISPRPVLKTAPQPKKPQPQKSQKDNDFEETLKKLREMSK